MTPKSARMRGFWVVALSLLVLAMGLSPGLIAQRRIGGRTRPSLGNEDPMSQPAPDRSLNRKMLKASYEQLQKDVERMAELANDLKEQVTKTDDEDVLSLSGVKKAEEIEKLAKKIQGRMKNL